jgi:hypothetical protein
MLKMKVSEPVELVAVTVYVILSVRPIGFPVMIPVDVLNDIPEGRFGVIL